MSMIKKIWIAAAVFVTIMIGFSVLIIKISGYDKVYDDKPTPKQKAAKEMVMKCGVGKCGAEMMDEIDKESASTK